MTISPTLVAHRGYAARFPENSMPALQAAAAVGARWLEFDVQLTADEVPVLLHDADLQRTGQRPESIFDLTATQLDGICIGQVRRFGDRFSSVRVPRLDTVVAWLVGEPQLHSLVEVKTESIARYGYDRVQRAVAHALAPIRERCIIISSDDAYLFAARLAAPARIGWILAEWNDEQRRRAQSLAPDLLLVDWRLLPVSAAELWDGPWRWAAYEITDPSFAIELASRGVSLIETMNIGTFLADPRFAARAAAPRRPA